MGWAAAVAGWTVVEVLGLALAYHLVLVPDAGGHVLAGWALVVMGGGYLVALLALTWSVVPILNGLLAQLAAEDTVEVTPTTLVHTRRRGPVVRRRSVDRTQVHGASVSGDVVAVRVGLADTWRLTALGVPAQRAALAAALSAWVLPAPPPSAAGPLPPVPRGWFVETVGSRDGLPVVRARMRPAVALRRACGLGVLAALLCWGGTTALLQGWVGQKGAFAWVMLALAAVATVGALGRLHRADAWEVGAGTLHVGRVGALSGRWARAPETVSGLRIEERHKGEAESPLITYVLLAVGDRRTVELLDVEPSSGSAQALGSWLAARARLPLEDRTRTPG